MLCENCGNQLAEGSVFCPKCGTNVGESAPATVSTSTESYFDGGVFQRLGWKLLGALVTGVTLGICYPFAVRWLYEWEAKHTVINGRRLKFVGTAGGLFGTWLLCLLLIVVTLGIYSIWVPLKIRKWREANTFFEDEIPTFDTVQNLKNEKASYFDGGLWQLIGWGLLGIIITIFTAGICYPWAIQMVYSWEQRHKVYNHKRCTFDGTAMQLFGTWLLCILLSIVTFGIYTWWVPLKIKKWQIKHTHLLEDETSAEEQEEKTLTAEEIEAKKIKKEKDRKIFTWVFAAGVALIFLHLIIRHRDFTGCGGNFLFLLKTRQLPDLSLFFEVVGNIVLTVSLFFKFIKQKYIKILDLIGIIAIGVFILASYHQWRDYIGLAMYGNIFWGLLELFFDIIFPFVLGYVAVIIGFVKTKE